MSAEKLPLKELIPKEEGEIESFLEDFKHKIIVKPEVIVVGGGDYARHAVMLLAKKGIHNVEVITELECIERGLMINNEDQLKVISASEFVKNKEYEKYHYEYDNAIVGGERSINSKKLKKNRAKAKKAKKARKNNRRN